MDQRSAIQQVTPMPFRALRIPIRMTRHLPMGVTAAVLFVVLISACQPPEPVAKVYELSETPYELKIPAGLPQPVLPKENPLTVEKVNLGRKLFFDKNLSVDRSVSCASCHDPEKFWDNGIQYGIGIKGREGTRNTPTLSNVVYQKQFFWDGRAGSLETQVMGPLLDKNEMGMPSNEAILDRLLENPEYEKLFGEAFSDGVTIINMAHALASYERTLLSGDSPYDRYMAGDKNAMSAAAIRGMKLFMGRARCNKCHLPPMFVDYSFHNLGIGMDQKDPDLGRYHVFKSNSARGKFRTPSLRDIAKTGPYMHDGSMKTLEETVEIYDKGGIPNSHLSAEVRRKLRLTDQQKKDVVTFMKEGLTSKKAAKK